MNETARLDLIKDAIEYCKMVHSKGMPKSAWSKALREPIHFLWEIRNGANLDYSSELSGPC